MSKLRSSSRLKLCYVAAATWLGVGGCGIPPDQPSSVPGLAKSVEKHYGEGELSQAYERAEKLRVELARKIIRQGIQELSRYMSAGQTGSFFRRKAYERIKAVDRDVAIEVLCDHAQSLGQEASLPVESRKSSTIAVVMQSFWDLRTTSYFNSLLDDRDLWRTAVEALQLLSGKSFGLHAASPPFEKSGQIRKRAREWALQHLKRAERMHRAAATGGLAPPRAEELAQAYERAEKLRVALAREIITQVVEEISSSKTNDPFAHKAYDRIKVIDKGVAIEQLKEYWQSLQREAAGADRREKSGLIGLIMGDFNDPRTIPFFTAVVDDRVLWREAVWNLSRFAAKDFGLNPIMDFEEAAEVRKKARDWALQRAGRAHAPAGMQGTGRAQPRAGELSQAYERAEKLRVGLAREIIRQGIQELSRDMSSGKTDAPLDHKAYDRIKAVDRDVAIEELSAYSGSLGQEAALPVESRKSTTIAFVMQSFLDLRTTSYFNSLLDDGDLWRMAVDALQLLAGKNFGLQSAPVSPEEGEKTRKRAGEWALRYLKRAERMHRAAAAGGSVQP